MTTTKTTTTKMRDRIAVGTVLRSLGNPMKTEIGQDITGMTVEVTKVQANGSHRTRVLSSPCAQFEVGSTFYVSFPTTKTKGIVEETESAILYELYKPQGKVATHAPVEGARVYVVGWEIVEEGTKATGTPWTRANTTAGDNSEQWFRSKPDGSVLWATWFPRDAYVRMEHHAADGAEANPAYPYDVPHVLSSRADVEHYLKWEGGAL